MGDAAKHPVLESGAERPDQREQLRSDPSG